MKTYRSHKVVKAAKIVSAEKQSDGAWRYLSEDDVVRTTSAEHTHRFGITEEDLGYVVVYEDGYVSWSPTKAFEEGYTVLKEPGFTMDFGTAINLLKSRHRLARDGWNGKDMFVFLVNGSQFAVNREPLLSILGEGTEVNYNPHIDIKQPDGSISTWVPSIGDVLAEDWRVVE